MNEIFGQNALQNLRKPGVDNDDELIAAALEGDAHAYEELYGRYAGRIFRTVLRIVRHREDAEDAVQESLMRAFRYLPTFRRTCAFSTWLTRIAINCALARLRHRRSGVESRFIALADAEDRRTFDLSEKRPSPEDLVVEAEMSHELTRAVALLPPILKDVMIVRYYKNASTKEIAFLSGLSEAAVKTRLHRARAELRRLLPSDGSTRRGTLTKLSTARYRDNRAIASGHNRKA